MSIRVAVLGSFIIGLLLGSLLPASSRAFVRSEDELMRASIEEAKARAKDFEKHQKRMKQLEEEREKEASGMREKRTREEAEAEKIRKEFVKKRKDPAILEAEQLKQEAQWEKQRLAEDEKAEKNRASFVQKRQKVQHIIENEAHIDEAREYGL